MKNIFRVELVWFDKCYDDHLEFFTCLASSVDDTVCSAMDCISAMPTFNGFRTLSLFRLEDFTDMSDADSCPY